jgi:hypothetical protein
MTGSGAIAVSGGGGPNLEDATPAPARGATAGGEPEFRTKWTALLDAVEARRSETDLETLLDDDLLARAYETASRYSGLVSVSEAPFGRNRDMVAHTREHFDDLFNDDACAEPFKRPPAATDVDALLEASELVYLDDAVARFSSETVFEPTPAGLERVAFYELPPSVSEWMMAVELLAGSLGGQFDVDRAAADVVDDLYGRRREFVERAMDADSFLLVPAGHEASAEEKRRKIETRVRRGADVDPADVHAYCYGRALDLA